MHVSACSRIPRVPAAAASPRALPTEQSQTDFLQGLKEKADRIAGEKDCLLRACPMASRCGCLSLWLSGGLPSCGREAGSAEDEALHLYILIALASSTVPTLAQLSFSLSPIFPGLLHLELGHFRSEVLACLHPTPLSRSYSLFCCQLLPLQPVFKQPGVRPLPLCRWREKSLPAGPDDLTLCM